MALIKTITWDYEFADWLKRSDNYKNNFTFDGANALQACLEQLSNDIDENIEFDPIAWCSEFTEYASAWEAMKQYQPDDMPVEGEDGDDLLEVQEKNEQAALEWLEDNTAVIQIDGTHRIVIRDF